MLPFSPPYAPESNPPIEPQFYAPWCFSISDISNGLTSLITTTLNNNYVVGQQVRLLVGPTYKARQFNDQTAYVLSIPNPNQVVLDIDSRNYDTFVNSGFQTPAQIVAIGDINNGIISSTGRVVPTTNVPGAFINVS